MVGIIIALVLCLIFILSALLIENFSRIFYIFGAFLLDTGLQPGPSATTRATARRAASSRCCVAAFLIA